MSSMIEVLEQHLKQNIRGCMCGWAEIGKSHTVHVADVLTKAGYGDLEVAWDEGFLDQWSSGRDYAKVANPYRRGQST